MHEALRAATARLAAVSDTPRLDAELLLANVLGVSRQQLLLGKAGHSDESQRPLAQHMSNDEVSMDSGFRRNDEADFQTLLARRLAHEPIAYIIGRQEFWGLDLRVSPAVLIPRPDSETLIEAALGHYKGRPPPARILDLGTGSGALLLAALSEFPKATGLGIDGSEAALEVARANSERLDLADRALFQIGDWCTGLAGTFDLILCNPPYVKAGATLAPNVVDYEPHSALFAGTDGLADYQRILPQLASSLAPDGVVCLEIGHTQCAAVTTLAEANGFAVRCQQDLGGRDRCLVLAREKALGIARQHR